MKYVIANLKSSMQIDDLDKYLQSIKKDLLVPNKVVFCPSNIYLKDFAKQDLIVASQNVCDLVGDNYTGAITVTQLKNLNINYVLLGHSEVRTILKETDEQIFEKIKLALKNNIKVILCVGESIEQKKMHHTLNIVKKQLKQVLSLDANLLADVVIAYEPVWAIGSGLTPTNQEIIDVLSYIKNLFINKSNVNINVLYGGSVNRNNIINLNMIDLLDGFLVGSASFKADTFIELVDAVYGYKK